MARSQRLITWRRLLVGTLVAVAVPAYILGAHATMVIWATTLTITAASIYYCNAIIGGVVGDYIGEAMCGPG
jgi:cobalamin synthase